MFLTDQSQFELAQFHDYLHRILATEATPVGTPLADALMSALEIDIRRSGGKDGVSRICALGFEQIVQVALELNWALEHENEFDMPLGSKAKSVEPGSVSIADECVVLDADRPGLFALDMTPRHARGRNLELLRGQIERMTRKLACRRIGLPSAHQVVERDSRHLLQFPPLAEAGGVVLQRSTFESGAARFCSATPAQIKAFAADIVLDMRALWSKRRAVAARVEPLRALLDGICAENPIEASVRSIDIEMKHQRKDDEFNLYVEYNAIDEAMRPGVVLDYVPARDRLVREWLRTPYGLWGRWKDKAMLQARGADGTIDDVALGILHSAPEGMASVLGRLAEAYEAQVMIPTGAAPLIATLYWADGCITAEISVAGKFDFFNSDRFEFKQTVLPDIVVDSLAGRPVSSVVELPFECPCTIESAETLGWGGLRIKVEPGKSFIEMSTGRIWK